MLASLLDIYYRPNVNVESFKIYLGQDPKQAASSSGF